MVIFFANIRIFPVFNLTSKDILLMDYEKTLSFAIAVFEYPLNEVSKFGPGFIIVNFDDFERMIL